MLTGEDADVAALDCVLSFDIDGLQRRQVSVLEGARDAAPQCGPTLVIYVGLVCHLQLFCPLNRDALHLDSVTFEMRGWSEMMCCCLNHAPYKSIRRW